MDEINVKAFDLSSPWTLWENYEPKTKDDEGYMNSIKEVTQVSNLLEFWQLWNNYEGQKFKDVFFDGERILKCSFNKVSRCATHRSLSF